MTVVRVGSGQKFATGWDAAFGRKKKTASKRVAKGMGGKAAKKSKKKKQAKK